jgi:CBS domain containing-hemolysin-like protein
LDWGAWLKLAAAFFLVFANGFFVAAEFALVKVRSTRLEELSRRGSRRAKTALYLSKHLDDSLGTSQLGITLASLALGWIGEPAFASILATPLQAIGIEGGEHGVATVLSFALITVLHIILGELAPKSLAIQRAEQTTLALAVPMRAFQFLSYPLLWVMNRTAAQVLRLFGLGEASEHEGALNPEELKMVVANSHRSGLVPERMKTILDRTFAFNERTAREIMVPRADTVFLSTDLTLEENQAKIIESGFTRFPVCEAGDPDKILGVIHVKDALLAGRKQATELRTLARPAFFVPAFQTADDLLQTFRRKKLHLAVVVDEYGGTLGIVTLEDVLEVLVGEIMDEHDDTEAAAWLKLPDGGLSVDAGVPASEAAERLGLSLGDDAPATLGGLVIAELGRVPTQGDKVTLGGREIEVTEMKKLRVTRVRVSAMPSAEPSDSH